MFATIITELDLEIALIILVGGGFAIFCFYKAIQSSRNKSALASNQESIQSSFENTLRRMAGDCGASPENRSLCFGIRGIKQMGTESYVQINSVQAYGAIFDDKNGQLILLSQRGIDMTSPEEMKIKRYAYSSILKYEIKIDGSKYMQPDVLAGVGGALIGGAVAGGVGAIVGGSMGGSNSRNKVKKIEICVTVNSLSNPVATIVLLDEQVDIFENSPKFKAADEKCRYFSSKLEVILHMNSESTKQ